MTSLSLLADRTVDMGLIARKPAFVACDKGTDQPALLQSDLCLFIHSLQCIISKFASYKISIFELVSVAE